jgi:hypothetical protein
MLHSRAAGNRTNLTLNYRDSLKNSQNHSAARGLRRNNRTWRLRPAPGRRRAVSVQEAHQVSTALVPITVSDSSACSSGDFGRPRADFLAQLIATVAQAPQTRMRRRAEPAEAVAIYGAVERRPAARRPALSRSL